MFIDLNIPAIPPLNLSSEIAHSLSLVNAELESINTILEDKVLAILINILLFASVSCGLALFTLILLLWQTHGD
ncbi:hypothetical protein DdX_00265 [Ditylenchus destructor]|uniref:Uncharacterized protein n=1 Tax=Ditylenchus destructor TaxID=166010 RepID=A0AAD4NJP2_9BILA|nr:hypothetical protein DdX_00265 [Ditylenchus destructor]